MGRVSFTHGLVIDSRSSIYQFSCFPFNLILNFRDGASTYLYLPFLEKTDNILVSPSLQRIFMNNSFDILFYYAFVNL